MDAPAFDALFGRDAEVRADAPGRVNLIGEHTDYNGGFVLPAAIPQRTRVELAARDDRTVRMWSAQLGRAIASYELGGERREGVWTDYVKGMTLALAEYGALTGFDLRVDSAVPLGAGLASSAALEIAVGRALRERFHLEVDDLALARAARRAENELVVVDSGISHWHAAGEYARRRTECDEAASLLGVGALRDVILADLDGASVLSPRLDRRVRHVITENQRVLGVVEALRRGDLAATGRLFLQSHGSMRDDFEVSVPPIDQLVEIAMGIDGVYGARLTGGGFGGSVVVLADAARAGDAAASIVLRYNTTTGYGGRVLVPPTP